MGGIPRPPCKFPTPTFWSREDKRWIESAPPVIPADAVGRIVLFSSWESGHRGNMSTGKSLYEMSVKKGRSEFAKWKKAVSDGKRPKGREPHEPPTFENLPQTEIDRSTRKAIRIFHGATIASIRVTLFSLQAHHRLPL